MLLRSSQYKNKLYQYSDQPSISYTKSDYYLVWLRFRYSKLRHNWNSFFRVSPEEITLNIVFDFKDFIQWKTVFGGLFTD